MEALSFPSPRGSYRSGCLISTFHNHPCYQIYGAKPGLPPPPVHSSDSAPLVSTAIGLPFWACRFWCCC
jgi:hypothetical protein